MAFVTEQEEHRLVLREISGLSEETTGIDDEILASILAGAAAFAVGPWGETEADAETTGPILREGEVAMTPSFLQVYRDYIDSGWGTVGWPETYNGQGLPFSVAMAVQDVLGTANFGLTACTTLTAGAIEAIHQHGSDAQRKAYLPNLISGAWTGTMNLTEPQAGTDVGALRAKAEPRADGKWSIKGTKIFISYGDHDMVDNIVHLILARTPGAPEGTKGVSLFLATKFLANDAGDYTVRNGMKVVSIEHKAGLHASPTCVMSFGDEEECIAEMIGPENTGMKAMFTMMNSARIGVGLQGVQLGEAATQKAVAYAKERIQGSTRDGQPMAIIEHPDVRRMLLRMKALTQASRALLFYSAGCLDRATAGSKEDDLRLGLLTPLAKTYGSEVGVEIASLGMQVHGGVGYIEETGAARYWKDARITPIYEGTSGVQAADLVGRKLGLEGGAVFAKLIAEMKADSKHGALLTLIEQCEDVAKHYSDTTMADRLSGSYPFLLMFSAAVSGWQLERQLAHLEDTPFGRSKQQVIGFYLDQIVPEASGQLAAAKAPADALFGMSADEF